VGDKDCDMECVPKVENLGLCLKTKIPITSFEAIEILKNNLFSINAIRKL